MEVCQGEEVNVQLSEEEEELRSASSRLVDEKLLVSALECPVCLCLPHSPPVYTCRVVHLIRHQHFSCLENLPKGGPTTLSIHPRLAILCVDAAGEVSPTDAQFVSTHITGYFLTVSKYHNINCSRCIMSQVWNNDIGWHKESNRQAANKEFFSRKFTGVGGETLQVSQH